MLTKFVDMKQKFGLRLRRAREAKGWTQTQLAEAVGAPVDETAVSRYEAGKSYPRSKRLEIFAQALGVSPGFLSGHAESSGPTDPTRLMVALRKAESARDELSEAIEALRSATSAKVIQIRPEQVELKAAEGGANAKTDEAKNRARKRAAELLAQEEPNGTDLEDSG